MQHTFPLALLSLTVGAVLATFVFPESITAYNIPQPTPATKLDTAPIPTPETPIPEKQVETIVLEGTTDRVDLPEAIPTHQEQSEPALRIAAETAPAIRQVPFFSQFSDIADPAWRKVACGVASLAMLVNYYVPEATTANELLAAGIAADAYTDNGWSHAGLIGLAQTFNLTGGSQSLAHLSAEDALTALTNVVAEGPVMASVHYTFEPTNPIPHLVVITHIADGYVYYNDPAEARGNGYLTTEKFKKAWKQRYIKIRPAS